MILMPLLRTWIRNTTSGEHASIEKVPQKGGPYEVSAFNCMNAKMDTLHENIDNLSIIPIASATPNCNFF